MGHFWNSLQSAQFKLCWYLTCQYTGDVTILAWHDKMRVMLVLTYHTDGMYVSAGGAIL